MATILVVEDDPGIRTALIRSLTDRGHAVTSSQTGLGGLQQAIDDRPDLVILDLGLPKLDGVEVCRKLRAAGDVPILILTARTDTGDRVEGLDAGADDYLVKPFSYVVLLAHVRALLRRGVRDRPAELIAGDLVVDPAARTCRRGDTEITLTSRELSVLEFLLRRAGEVVSKSEIVEHVWDMHFDGDLNVVEVHVSALRRKIDTPFDRHAIYTVRGSGYRLDANGG